MGKVVSTTAARFNLSERITFVISSLTAGGAERIISIMANYWATQGKKVTLITLAGASIPCFYKLSPDIEFVPLGIAEESQSFVHAILNNLARVKLLRKTIAQSRPDVVISFIAETNVLVSLATRGLKAIVIISERNEPTMQNLGRMWNILRRITYPFADHVVVVSEYARNYFPKKVRRKTVMIPNPVIQPEKSDAERLKLPSPAIVAMGRFVEQKGFDLLLEAFARIKDKHPEWSLTILGDGKLRSTLKLLKNNLDLNSRVSFPGIVDNPYEYLKQADLFVLSSRYEGFPNALCEAMASGTAVISFDCKTGPSEIIKDGVDGILVPPEDVGALADAMSQLMGDETKRNSLKVAAREVTNRFSIKKVMGIWDDLVRKN